jgi:hypothetical protein
MKILVDLFNQIRKKLVIVVQFKGFINISQKPKSSPLSYFAQKTSLNLAPNWYPIIFTCPFRSDSCSYILVKRQIKTLLFYHLSFLQTCFDEVQATLTKLKSQSQKRFNELKYQYLKYKNKNHWRSNRALLYNKPSILYQWKLICTSYRHVWKSDFFTCPVGQP